MRASDDVFNCLLHGEATSQEYVAALRREAREARKRYRQLQREGVNGCAHFCTDCGVESWHLRGSDVDTCRRGHHHPCEGGFQ